MTPHDQVEIRNSNSDSVKHAILPRSNNSSSETNQLIKVGTLKQVDWAFTPLC
jgi:hypothetical protein